MVSTTGNELEADSRLFSTYAIGYKGKTAKNDTKKTNTTKKRTNKTSGKSPKTGDAGMLGLWVTMKTIPPGLRLRGLVAIHSTPL